MESGLLEKIEGLSSEDLTTEWLAHLLSDPSYDSYQRLFYSLLLRDGQLKDTVERGFEVKTQCAITKQSRPDLVIKNEDATIIIENKFYAFFSDYQMPRYFRYLRNQPSKTTRRLVLLTTGDRVDFYRRHMRQQFVDAGELNNDDCLSEYGETHGVQLSTVSWEKVFKVFGGSDSLISELKRFIFAKYIASSTLSEEELALLSCKEVPEIMSKIWNGVYTASSILQEDEIKTGKLSASQGWYGFSVNYSWGSPWVGYSNDCWLKHRTPYAVQLCERWLHEGQDALRQLTDMGFSHDADLEYMYPIPVKGKDLAIELSQGAKRILDELDDLFSED